MRININEIVQASSENYFKHDTSKDAYIDLINIRLPFDEFEMFDDRENASCVMVAKFKSLDTNSFTVETRCILKDIIDEEIFTHKFVIENDKLVFKKDSNGKYELNTISCGRFVEKAPEHLARKLFKHEMQFVYACLFSLSIINCKNVTLMEVDPCDKLSRQVKRNMVRKNIPFPNKHHVIDIKPFKGKKITQNKHNFSEQSKSFHICRGHFRTYQGKGLFGKYKGTFWIPSHTKGTGEKISQEYKIRK